MNFDTALGLALKRLQRSDVFASEIEALLTAKGFDGDAVEQVISHLSRRRMIDDRRTIQNLVEQGSGKRATGKEKLRADLLKRGAPENLVDECLAGLSDEDELERMTVTLKARCKLTDSRAKGARLLLARGFSEESIERALDGFFGSAELSD